MIIVKDLTLKNFMSVGNPSSAVDFPTDNLHWCLEKTWIQGGDDRSM